MSDAMENRWVWFHAPRFLDSASISVPADHLTDSQHGRETCAPIHRVTTVRVMASKTLKNAMVGKEVPFGAYVESQILAVKKGIFLGFPFLHFQSFPIITCNDPARKAFNPPVRVVDVS